MAGEDMRVDDVQTKKIIRSGTSYSKAIEQEWFEFMGYTQKELDADEIEVCFTASRSKKHEQNYIGMFKPRK
jgi:hypothetical protein